MEEDYEEEYYQPSIHEVREWSQNFLEAFTFNFENKFDESIEKLIKLITDDKKFLKKELEKYPNQILKVDDVAFETENFQHELERHSLSIEDYSLDEELKALVEMKIIYAFKTLEINIKKILTNAFHINNERDLFQWNKLIDYTDNRGVKFENIKGYQEINQLRQVNNSIKHSEKLDEKTLKIMFDIKEFNNIPEFHPVGKLINYKHLLSFYNRIEPFIIPFLEDLCSAIYNQLYVYDEEKLEGIAEGLVLKMEREDAFKLIEKIKNLY